MNRELNRRTFAHKLESSTNMAASHRTDVTLSRGSAKPPSNPPLTSKTWDDEKLVAALRKLWPAGTFSVSGIARHLSMKFNVDLTPNMVTGKAQRLNLGKKPERIKYGRSAARNKAAARPPKTVPAPVPQTVRVLVPGSSPMMVAKCPEPEMARIPLTALKDGLCHWPISDPLSANFSFCGCKTAKGSYCAFHAAIAFVPVQRAYRKKMQTVAA